MEMSTPGHIFSPLITTFSHQTVGKMNFTYYNCFFLANQIGVSEWWRNWGAMLRLWYKHKYCKCSQHRQLGILVWGHCIWSESYCTIQLMDKERKGNVGSGIFNSMLMSNVDGIRNNIGLLSTSYRHLHSRYLFHFNR